MQYTEITLNEMKSLLNECGGNRWREVKNASTKERVYEYPLERNENIVVKLYTSIHLETDVSRRKGADAIRICAVNIKQSIGWIKTVKVLRVHGWRDNLRKAIKKVIDKADRRLGYNSKKVSPKVVSRDMWTASDNNTFAVEVSTLNANRKTLPRNMCPKCDKYYSKKNLVKTHFTNDIDHELTHWEFKCPHCQSALIIFND